MQVEVLQGCLFKATRESVGYDLFSAEDCLLPPGSVKVVGTGLVTRMEGVFGLICDRSGLAAKFGVSRRAGVIDPDYTQEWKVVLVNESLEPYQVKIGDRIAQVIFLPLASVEVTGSIEGFHGRSGGFGSTGK